MRYILFFDGSSSASHEGSYGVVIRGGYAADIHGTLADGPHTNNEAEYSGLIAGLEHMLGNADAPVALGDELSVQGDSQLVIKQMIGEYAVRAPNLVPLHSKAISLVSDLEAKGIAVNFEWVPRERNEEADAISRPSPVVNKV